MSRILITGAAGFIGSHLASRLLKAGHSVTGIDNFDSFYDRSAKERNLRKPMTYDAFEFREMDILDTEALSGLHGNFDLVIHLAARAGVRPSIQAPDAYIQTNIAGTQNIVNWMKNAGIGRIIFAGSSSVYGNNRKIPFSETDNVDFPISPYAYTKKAAELLLHSCHHLDRMSVICLRFFTVYGPGQRPDLAIHKFTRLIDGNEPITMYGDGSTSRDYTYIDDITAGIQRAVDLVMGREEPMYEIINLGNNRPVKLSVLIDTLSKVMGKTPRIEQLPMQPGDVDRTYADISKAQEMLGYAPETELESGLSAFVAWYRNNHD